MAINTLTVPKCSLQMFVQCKINVTNRKAKSKSWALVGLEYQLTGMSEYRDCMGVQTSFCEGGRKQSYPQTKLSVTRVSDVIHES